MSKPKKKSADIQRIYVSMLSFRNPEVSLAIAKEADEGRQPNLDQGLYSNDECRSMLEAAKSGKIKYPYMYDPVIAELGKARNARFGILGQRKKHRQPPKDWPSKFGAWSEGGTLVDFRLMHNIDIRKNCRITPGALVSVGSYEYIVGTTGEDGLAAPYCIDASKRGNYAANCRVAKRLSYVNMVTESGRKVTKTEFSTVVGQLNNKSVLLTLEDGGKIAIRANQSITWGHLVKDNKVLTPSQIRSLRDSSGVKFVALKERWIGTAFTKDEYWKEVQREMKETRVTNRGGKITTLMDRYESRPARSEDKIRQLGTKDSAWANLSTVQTRDCPDSLYCYGLRYALIGQAIGRKYSDDGKSLLVFVILGGHLTHGLTQTKWQVNASIKSASKASSASAEKKTLKANKPKSDKPKSDKPKKGHGRYKVKKSKAEKPTSEPVPTDEKEVRLESEDVKADALGIEDDEDAQIEADALGIEDEDAQIEADALGIEDEDEDEDAQIEADALGIEDEDEDEDAQIEADALGIDKEANI